MCAIMKLEIRLRRFWCDIVSTMISIFLQLGLTIPYQVKLRIYCSTMKKKLIGALCAGAVLLNCAAVVAYAASSSVDLSYNGVTAHATLDCDFGNGLLGHYDNADAVNVFTSSDTKGYWVAVRLEAWGSDEMIGYKYDRSTSRAECTYSWSDVSYFESRNSIDKVDEYGNTVKELVVRNLHDNEGLG